MEVAKTCFIKGRHQNISSIFLTQNLYLQDKAFRIIGLNCSHTILCKSRDLKQISLFAGSFLEKKLVASFIEVYKQMVQKKKFGYILIDFQQDIDSPIAVRTNVFNETPYESAFALTS